MQNAAAVVMYPFAYVCPHKHPHKHPHKPPHNRPHDRPRLTARTTARAAAGAGAENYIGFAEIEYSDKIRLSRR